MMMRLLWLSIVLAIAAAPACAQWREAVGPPGGVVTAAAIDPFDADSIFVATRLLCRSTDGGKTWTPVEGFPYDAVGGGIQCIAISRQKDGPILIPGGRLVVSLDRGKTWEKRDAPRDVMRILAGAEGSRVLYAVGPRAIHRSDDNGATWQKLEAWKDEEGWIESFGADRFDPDTISFTHRTADRTQWVLSRDGGKSFSARDLPQDAQALLSTSTDPDDPDLLYVCIRSGFEVTEQRKFLFSYDNGETWDLFWDPNSGTVAPELTRKKLEHTFPDMLGSPLPGPWHETAAHERSTWSEDAPGRLLVWSWQGTLYGSDDFGATWKPAFGRLVMTEVGRILFDPKEPKTVYCWGERGAWRTTDGGATWQDLPVGQYWFQRQVAFAPDGETVFIVADAVYRNKRGDEKWEPVWRPQDYNKAPITVFFTKAEAAEAKPGFVAVLVGSGIRVESKDGGTTWGDVGKSDLDLGPWPKRFVELTVDGETKWLAHELNRRMLASADQGRTWKPFGPDGGFEADSWSLAADGAFWTVRAGKARIGRPLDEKSEGAADLEIAHPRLVTCDPADARVAYFADGNNRILRTTDGGKTFELLDGGPTEFQINELAISPHDGALWVATSGNGVWILDKPKAQPGKAMPN